MGTAKITAAVLALGASLASCGLGSVGAVVGLGSDGTNAPSSVTAFGVEGPKTAPATVRFTLTDPEGDTATLELCYQAPGEPVRRMEHVVSGMPSNPGPLASAAGGRTHAIVWDFAAEADLPSDASYVPDVLVWARAPGSAQGPVLGVSGARVGLGNDPPALVLESPSGEVSGVVPIRFTVADSSNDPVRIRVQYRVLAPGGADWTLARPAGLTGQEPTPEFAVQGLVAPPGGRLEVFFWDTDHDLPQLEHDVLVRFTPEDAAVVGATVSSAPFRVDNNREPILRLLEGAFLTHPDGRRGVPIPFELFDAESDEVLVVFQWRRLGQGFPALPSDPLDMAAILEDPMRRRELRICSSYPAPTGGRLQPVDPFTVELPELLTEAAHLRAGGLVARRLEILRPSRLPRPVEWKESPLSAPAAALGLRSGTHALVLDGTGQSWRLVEIEVGSGRLVREVASGAGDGSALAFQRGEGAVLVASDVAGAWSVVEVDLASGAQRPHGTHSGTVEGGTVRGLASLGTDSCVLTVGGSLVRLDRLGPAQSRAVTLLSGLATPWGVVVDPLRLRHVYVAERDAPTDTGPGRVLSVALDTGLVRPVVARPSASDGAVLRRPRALAVTRRGTRLLALCESPRSALHDELRGLDLGGAAGNGVFALGEPMAPDAASLAVGDDELVLIAHRSSGTLRVGGGVEQVRTIAEHAPESLRVVLSEELNPLPRPAQPWRIDASSHVYRGSPGGVQRTFVWDSADAAAVGEVFVRATPYDSERGLASSASGAKSLHSLFGQQRIELPGGPLTRVLVVDLDGDGLEDLVGFDPQALRVRWKEGRTSFAETDTVVAEGSYGAFSTSIAVADMDGDGLLDLVLADSTGIRVYRQASPREFLPGAEVSAMGHSGIAVGDLDGDGRPDIAALSPGAGVRVFWSEEGGGYVEEFVFAHNFSNSLLAVDLDGNGLLDLVTTVEGQINNDPVESIATLLQGSPRVFELHSIVGHQPTGGSNPLAAADVDGDGWLDLLMASSVFAFPGPTPNTLAIFRQESPGHFGSEPLRIPVQGTPTSLDVVDVDQDGLPAAVIGVAGFLGQNAVVLRQVAPGVFEPSPDTVEGTSSTVVPADLDGDGRLDLLSSASIPVTIYPQDAPGSFGGGPEVLASAPDLENPYQVMARDLDGDGALDVLAWFWPLTYPFGTLEPGTRIQWQLPSGFMEPGSSYLPLLLPHELADLDGDGLQDLLVSSYQEIRLILQGPAREFSSEPILLSHASLRFGGLATADLDGDGRLEVLASGFAEGISSLLAFYQTEPGVFAPVPSILATLPGLGPSEVLEVSDLDGDGSLDLVFQLDSPGRAELVILWGISGPSPAQSATVIGTIEFAGSYLRLAVEDLDGDGLADLVVSDGGLRIFWQEEKRTFSAVPTTLPPSHQWIDVLGARVLRGTGTGAPVIAVGGSGPLQLFEVLEGRTLNPSPPVLHGAYLVADLEVRDLDGDGDADLLAIDPVFNRLLVWYGGR